MNCYATLDDLKSKLGVSGTTRDSELMRELEAASREVDYLAGRRFYVETATKYFDGPADDELLIDDCQNVTALTVDTEADGTYDGETWTENTDFYLRPDVDFPKWHIWQAPWGNYGFAEGARNIQIVGSWGYGNGRDSNPWESTAITATVADATATTLTLSAEGTIKAGQTIKVEDEQMFVSAVTSDESSEATVVRGVNGTTAAEHTAADAYVAEYPADVVRACIYFAKATLDQTLVFESERIGDYSYKLATAGVSQDQKQRLLGRVAKVAIA